MPDNHLAKNIKKLRKTYGETQNELAMAIGLDSPNTIANYEKGVRYPKPEIRRKIALHYRVTEDALLYSNFSGIPLLPTVINGQKLAEMLIALFPTVASDKARKSATFIRAYEAHMRVIEAVKAGKEWADNDLDICFDSYYFSYEKEGVLDAIVNLLGWFVLFEWIGNNPQLEDYENAFNINSAKLPELLKSFFLRDMSEDGDNQVHSEMAFSEIEEFDEEINKILRKLKKDAHFSNLADYYIALRYLFGGGNNELTEDMNHIVGREMMWSLAEFGNKYANNFFRII